MVGDNPGMQQRLLAKFLLNAHRQVAQILAAAQLPAAGVMAGVAHTLKSAARTVGALALGELCQQIETSGRAGDVSACLSQAQGLEAALSAAEQRILQHCPSVGSCDVTTPTPA